LRDKTQEKALSYAAFALPEELKINESKFDTLILKMMNPLTGVTTGKRKILLKSYDNCFDGLSGTKWIQSEFKVDADKAVQIGQTLFMNRHAFHSIIKKHESFHAKSDALYRFKLLEMDESRPLNACKRYIETVKEEAWEVSVSLIKEAIKLLQKFKSEKNVIDWALLKVNPDYYKFNLRSSKLQKVSLNKLTNERKLLFWLNIYNTLLIHAHILYGPPLSVIERKAMWAKSYKIDSHAYSADSILTILRGKPEQLPHDLTELDGVKVQFNPMIHFCCFNGSDSSPPFHVFSDIDTLMFKMKEVSKNFLERVVFFKNDDDELWIPKLFKDYPEFGEKKDILNLLCQFVESKVPQNIIRTYSDSIELKYTEKSYDNIQYLE